MEYKGIETNVIEDFKVDCLCKCGSHDTVMTFKVFEFPNDIRCIVLAIECRRCNYKETLETKEC